MMKYSKLLYITRSQYNSLSTSGFSISDIVNVIEGVPVDKKVSPLTLAVLQSANSKVRNALCNASFVSEPQVSDSVNCMLTKTELQYADDLASNDLVIKTEEPYCSNVENQKCYEIVIHSRVDTLYLVVICEEGFLSLVTDNPESLLGFYRETLRHSFGHDAPSEESLREYLGLKMVKGQFNLVKTRVA